MNGAPVLLCSWVTETGVCMWQNSELLALAGISIGKSGSGVQSLPSWIAPLLIRPMYLTLKSCFGVGALAQAPATRPPASMATTSVPTSRNRR